MKWPRTQQTANKGVIFVKAIVNDHGSIFHPIHQESDVGIDGHIELVASEVASGRLIAVQIKSGDSYYSEENGEFKVQVDQEHISYWESYSVPVILICYAPTKNIAVWVSVGSYINREKQSTDKPITSIRIPGGHAFDKSSLDEDIRRLANSRADEKILFHCANNCFNSDSQTRRNGLSILAAHPDSRDSRVTLNLAHHLMFDEDNVIAKDALYILGYAVARFRWSFHPGNEREERIMSYARSLCRNFTDTEMRKLVELVDEEHFSGPNGLGERCFDILGCCDRSHHILDEIASDNTQPMERRANALYMLYDCDDADLQNYTELADDPNIGEVYKAMYGVPESSADP